LGIQISDRFRATNIKQRNALCAHDPTDEHPSPVIPDLEVELADANTLSLAVR
jgi:hypothetical protein